MKKSAHFLTKTTQGFTLVELLVVIAIIAILAAVVVLIINPLELTRRGRDSTRVSDLANLQNAINVAVQEATNSGSAVLCSVSGSYPCNGNSVSDARVVNGSGWVKVNLAASAQSVSVPTLPVDPVNSTGTTGFHYVYCANADTWEIDAKLESQQQASKMTSDGGDNNALYEVGSALGLVDSVSGCVY